MDRSASALAFFIAIALPSCSDSASEADAVAPGRADTASNWLPRLVTAPSKYPPGTQGSAYEPVTMELFHGSDKDEFESTDAFKKRLALIPSKIQQKHGATFAFKAANPDGDWNADTNTLTFEVDDGVVGLAVDQNDGVFKELFAILINDCRRAQFTLTPQLGKKLKEQLYNEKYKLFYVGSIDYSAGPSLPGFRKDGPGLQVMTPDSRSFVYYLQFSPQKVDVVDSSTGDVVFTINC